MKYIYIIPILNPDSHDIFEYFVRGTSQLLDKNGDGIQVMTYMQTLQVTSGLVIFIQLMKAKQELVISDMNQKI